MKKKKLYLAVILPAYNEEKSIKKILQSIPYPCLVINDCSSDNTEKEARLSNTIVITHKKNLGTGQAIKTGLQALENEANYVVTMDADGQHDPIYVKDLIEEINQTNANVIIASRYIRNTRPATSTIRILGTACISLWMCLWFGKRIYDPTSGFRIYNKKAVQFLAKHYPTTFPEPESLLLLLINGFAIKEIPVTMKKRLYGTSSISFYKAIKLFLYILALIPMYRIQKLLKLKK